MVKQSENEEQSRRETLDQEAVAQREELERAQRIDQRRQETRELRPAKLARDEHDRNEIDRKQVDGLVEDHQVIAVDLKKPSDDGGDQKERKLERMKVLVPTVYHEHVVRVPAERGRIPERVLEILDEGFHDEIVERPQQSSIATNDDGASEKRPRDDDVIQN